jgi:hypothetical protein
MSDGGPNGYSVMEFDGEKYSLDIVPASRPANYQMNIYTPEVVKKVNLPKTVTMVNVFNGSEKTTVAIRVDRQGEWIPMERFKSTDPAFVAEKQREEAVNKEEAWTNLPGAYATPHMWRAMLPTHLGSGTHVLEVRAENAGAKTLIDQRIFRVETD